MPPETKPCNFRCNHSALRGIRRLPQFDTSLGALHKTTRGAGSISDSCIQQRITLGSELMRGCDGLRVGRISACGSSGNGIELAVRSCVEFENLHVAVTPGTIRT